MSTRRSRAGVLRPALAVPMLGLAALGAGCSGWFFSSPIPEPDRSRPVVLIETQGGIEHGVATDQGVLFLGRTAKSGPCRVRYMLGDTVNLEDGEIHPFGGWFYEARTPVKMPAIHVLARDLTPEDDVLAQVFPPGGRPRQIRMRRPEGEVVQGNVLEPASFDLPVGTPLFVRDEVFDLMLVGLVTGKATWIPAPGAPGKDLVVYAGPDVLREALAVPRKARTVGEPLFRPDGIQLRRQDREPVLIEPIGDDGGDETTGTAPGR